ncbi:hypothetical protein BaRGS_00026401, partial [Batillaria attramentaria]
MDWTDIKLNSSIELTNATIIAAVMDSVRRFIGLQDKSVLRQGKMGSRLLKTMDLIAREGVLPEGDITLFTPEVMIRVFDVDTTNFSGLTLEADRRRNNIFQEPEVNITEGIRDSEAEVNTLILPRSLFNSLNSSRIFLAVYVSGEAFEAIKQQQQNLTVDLANDGFGAKDNSYVLSASVVGYDYVDLLDPVIVKFELDGDAGISGIHEVVLSGISEIGCIVSLIALILTIITYLIFNPSPIKEGSSSTITVPGVKVTIKRAPRLSNPSKILISLCLSLAIVNILYIVGMLPYIVTNIVA